MLKIQIASATSTQRSFATKNGQMTFSEQEAFIDLPNGERRKIRVPLRGGRPPYAVGAYTVGDVSYTVGQYGDLQISRDLELAPFPASVK